MKEHGSEGLFTPREDLPSWDRVFTVNPGSIPKRRRISHWEPRYKAPAPARKKD